ncbi:MAG: outer membrane protein assembly factor BamD [Kiritimatiellae bacterium]|nr:outer membrane protein assembly factor BamD [Kiritimatiellia bacterium]
MICKRAILAAASAGLAGAASAASGAAGMPSASTRYATDAYPGFDREENIIATSKKTPRWFSWMNGPAQTNAAEQLAWAKERQAEGSWRTARRGYDALVREWPSSPEAPLAQKALADMYFEHYLEYENAFEEYRYLLDFYSSQCDYDAMVRRLYDVARMMEQEGKTLVFFRFANTVDVRRAFEAVVLRAPGADFAPQALLTVAKLREDDGEYEKAVLVYENLRSLHPNTPEAKTALHREGRARMELLRKHGYNRSRCQDDIDFLKAALATNPAADAKADFTAWLQEAVALVEDEAFASAKFYDSKTRTRRSAINAYERFLSEYPASRHAPEARERLTALQSGQAN